MNWIAATYSVWDMVLVCAILAVFEFGRERYRFPPGTAVRWGPFQHGVVTQGPDLRGWCKVQHAGGSRQVFAVPVAQLRRVVW